MFESSQHLEENRPAISKLLSMVNAQIPLKQRKIDLKEILVRNIAKSKDSGFVIFECKNCRNQLVGTMKEMEQHLQSCKVLEQNVEIDQESLEIEKCIS